MARFQVGSPKQILLQRRCFSELLRGAAAGAREPGLELRPCERGDAPPQEVTPVEADLGEPVKDLLR
jgi:hypothetical protein